MTQEQFLRAMTNIDDTFILEAMPRLEPKPKRGAGEWIRYAVAACLCLLVIGSILWQVVKPVPAKAFEIEDGVLLAYHGTDAEVVIPDEVTKISASAFATAPSPDSITSVTLGTNVEIIDPLTFAETKNLDTITVPEENNNFYCREGVLLAADGSLAIDTARAYEDSMDIFVDVIRDITDGKNIFGDTVSFVFGKAKITVSVEENPAFEMGDDLWAFPCYMTAIDFDGTHLELKDRVPMMANSMWDFYQSEDVLVYANVNRSGDGDIYLLCAGEIWDLSNPPDKGFFSLPDYQLYNDSIFFYGADENGITYERRPRKYVFTQTAYFDLMYCTGYDELYSEEGYVTIENGEIKYNPTKTQTVRGNIDLEGLFEGYYSTGYNQGTPYRPRFEKLEEMLSYNKEHYESWK